MKRREGLIDPTQERLAAEGRRSLQEHVADFRAFLAAKGNTDVHVNQTCRQVERVIADCHAKQVNDLSGSAALGVIGKLTGQRNKSADLQFLSAGDQDVYAVVVEREADAR